MFRKPHPFILKVQKEQNKFFSCYRVMNTALIEKNDKFKTVYLNAAYPATYYNEIIYKTQDDFYLFYRGDGIGDKYQLEFYFLPESENQVKIFLNSIIKKQK